jgi:hypothetical protein
MNEKMICTPRAGDDEIYLGALECPVEGQLKKFYIDFDLDDSILPVDVTFEQAR